MKLKLIITTHSGNVHVLDLYDDDPEYHQRNRRLCHDLYGCCEDVASARIEEDGEVIFEVSDHTILDMEIPD